MTQPPMTQPTMNQPGTSQSGTTKPLTMQDVLLTFGGGANEVHRNIVAMVGLGMPRK